MFGQNDVFLRAIESHFECRLVARGDSVLISGYSEDVDHVTRLLQDLVTRVKQGDYITDQYLTYAIAMVKENGRGPADEISTSNLITSSLKKVIKPKREGLTYEEAMLIKKWWKQGKLKKKPLIKEGIAYLPAFLIASLLTLLFGNLMILMVAEGMSNSAGIVAMLS